MVIHDWFGLILLVVAAGGAVVAVLCVFRPQALPFLRRYIRLTLAAVALQVLIGIVVFAAGNRPHQVIHLFYGIATLLALPFSMWMGGPLKDRERRIWLAGGAVATFLFATRAVMTG
ncbi:MAG TPA: hypothetical protein VI434_15305 [Candidatus Dormibacteraeota bacterium]